MLILLPPPPSRRENFVQYGGGRTIFGLRSGIFGKGRCQGVSFPPEYCSFNVCFNISRTLKQIFQTKFFFKYNVELWNLNNQQNMCVYLVVHVHVSENNFQGVNQKVFIGAIRNKFGNFKVHKCKQNVFSTVCKNQEQGCSQYQVYIIFFLEVRKFLVHIIAS